MGLEVSFQIILGLFAPSPWLIGVPWEQAQAVRAIGTKIVINEFVAFIALVQDQTLNRRAKAIVTFAPCGFANISSMAIHRGLGPWVPERKVLHRPLRACAPSWRGAGEPMSASRGCSSRSEANASDREPASAGFLYRTTDKAPLGGAGKRQIGSATGATWMRDEPLPSA